MEIREINRKQKNTMSAIDRENKIKEMRKADDPLINGMFEFIDAQGGWLDFAYRKYPGESIKMIRLTHGEVCEIPRGIVKHLNNTRKKVRRYNLELPPDGRGKPARSFEVQSRVRFTPVDVL